MSKTVHAKPTVLAEEVEAILRAEHADPFSVLGPHRVKRGAEEAVAIRAFLPRARDLRILYDEISDPLPAERVHPDGFFEAVMIPPDKHALLRYHLRITHFNGATEEVDDPYAFPPLLTDFDLHLIGEGTHFEKYEKLGAHVRQVNGTRGAHFAVWAPNARRVSVVGDFNLWDGRAHPMRPRGMSGIWELFLPGLDEGLIYKFEIRTQASVTLKSDPYAFFSELRPKTASIVCNIDRYEWHDAEWVEQREKRDWLSSPISIYEVHAASWRRSGPDGRSWLTYRELADQLIPYVKQLGYTHIELMPVMEHPFDASWGYQTVGYFAATSRFGTPSDLMHFIDRCHQEGIGVILDWTPAHFPRDAHGLAHFDGTHLYEHADPRQGAHPDWGTLVFNYGRNEVQNFLISNALFWLDKYHVDGLRMDAVASMLYLDYSRKPGEWVPNRFGGRENLEAVAFLKRLNEVLHGRHPGVLTIAEESTAWPMVSRPTYLGGLGFSLKWNLGWMHDTLDYFGRDPIHRKYHHNRMTFSMLYTFTENFVLPFSHDEVVHGKRSLIGRMPGDYWQQFANLRLLYAYMYGHPGKKLLFMGGEFGQWIEWNHDQSLDWHLLDLDAHRGVQRLMADLNRLYRAESALHEVDFDWHGFEWLDCNDADASVLSFLRRGRSPDECVVVVCNFTPVPRENYRVGVPERGYYKELLNTDAAIYGGSNMGNYGGVHAEPVPWFGHDYSLRLALPPMAAVFLKLQRG
ncbi:MAG: 1,4-alpha-glucan branching protein GlgB [Acidobacteria bacterium]|nr:1,4-alpha-glucan branching protein GlgB [Acidobacteriota bacterium]MBI3663628.1 1,4-alpha-glucan branching protein GlgB [Acidobacteriota bacterium]